MTKTTEGMAGRVVIITGGGTGVGRATCVKFAKDGYSVVVVYSRSMTEASSTVDEIVTAGGKAIAVRADVSVDSECRAMVAETLKTFGRIDVLINCAGTTDFIPFQNLEAVTDDVWERLYKVNVVGAFHCARAVQAAMLL